MAASVRSIKMSNLYRNRTLSRLIRVRTVHIAPPRVAQITHELSTSLSQCLSKTTMQFAVEDIEITKKTRPKRWFIGLKKNKLFAI